MRKYHWIIALCMMAFFAVPVAIAMSPTNEADCEKTPARSG